MIAADMVRLEQISTAVLVAPIQNFRWLAATLTDSRIEVVQHQRAEEQPGEQQQLGQQPGPHAHLGGMALLCGIGELLVRPRCRPAGTCASRVASPGVSSG